MALDYLKELVLLGAQEKVEMECENVHKAVDWRQKVYGMKKQMLKPGNMDLEERKAASGFETKILDKNRVAIRFNGADYKAKYDAGDFSPCYFIVQPKGTDTNMSLAKILADKIEAGMLPSQIKERKYLDSLKETSIGKIIDEPGAMAVNPFNPPAPASPFDAIRKAEAAKDKKD